ncbi:hypothetical protein evm_003799 [Chilo suppressalis]|nr:hypothetical protein evm_003799 [Chilo suppressalis]
MFDTIKIKDWLDWPLIRVHLCTLAVTLSFNSTLRVPREAARYGGLQYALALTLALLVVALPLVLLQLAVGQLSQQDAVGLWRAVPIFKGVGYLRLLVSFFGSIYTSIYLALSASYFLYTIRHSIPFIECPYIAVTENDYLNGSNSASCLDLTFMSPVNENPEYYIALCLIIFFTWICLPFLLYSPVKLMKRVFYLFGPLVVILSIVTVSGMADNGRIQWMVKEEDWRNFLQPHIWFGAITQALLTSEVAGGYLISAGDSIYSNNDVRWTAIALIGTSIVVNWVGLIFWFSIGGSGNMETSSAAVIEQIYVVAVEKGLSIAWPLVAFAVLILSGIITMLTRLYPMYDRVRRVGGVRWRIAVAVSAIVCASASVAVLAGRWHALAILEALAVPLIVCVATVLEVLVFICIYGWKLLTEDVEFLTGDPLQRVWVWVWCLAACIVASVLAWWAATVGTGSWQLAPWPPAVLTATGVLTALILVICAASAVAKQVQYDILGVRKILLIYFISPDVVDRGGWHWQLAPWPPAVLTATGVLTALILVIFAASSVAKQVQYDIVGVIKILLLLAWSATVVGTGSWQSVQWSPAIIIITGGHTTLILVIFAASSVAKQVQNDIVGVIKIFLVLAAVVGTGNRQLAPWSAAVLTATGVLTALILVIFAAIAVPKQVQYHIVGVRL